MKPAIFSKLFDDRSLEDAILAAADIGYDGLEIMARDPHLPHGTSHERAAELAELLSEHDVSVPCLATYTGGYSRKSDEECEAELEKLEAFLELSQILDVDVLRHGPGGPSIGEATDDHVERAATWLRKAADLAAAYNRTIAIEIHANRLSETTDATLRLLELIDRENVGVIHDAGNMFLVDDPYGPESIEKLDDRLVHVHYKDISRIDDRSVSDAFTVSSDSDAAIFRRECLGDGDIDYELVFDALAERGYDGHLTTETFVSRIDPEAVARRELSAFEQLVVDG